MANTLASPLSRKATLIKLSSSAWSGKKVDKKVTRETNERYHADDDAGEYRKRLVEKKALERVGKAESAARALFEKYTKPWSRGMGILPNALHAEFSNEWRKIQYEHDEAADEFAALYSDHVDEMKAKLNGMYDQNDYPDPAVIRDRFALTVKPYPVPDVGDFRSDVLDEATVADIKREMQEASEEVLRDALKDTVAQITKTVGHMAEKLREYGKGKDGKKSFFFDSLVGNVRDLAKLLPAFNLTNDPNLAKVAARISKELTVEDAQALRDNEAARETVAKSAEDILKDVSVLFG